MKRINLGLIGFGTIGTGVVKILQKNRPLISKRTGIDLRLIKIADLNLKTDRGVKINKNILTTNADEIINDPKIDIVIELIGGMTKAREIIVKSLKKGKHVVTANKALLSHYGKEFFKLAREKGKFLKYEASVGGVIPIIKIIQESLIANKIQKIMGIINGTTNFILTEMEDEKLDFDTALKKAQKAGFAEADPTLDISGGDAAHKIQILASLAYNTDIPFNKIYYEGITKIDLNDILYIKELGYKIKLLAIIKADKSGEIECRVHPTLISENNLLAAVKNENNAIYVEGDVSRPMIFYGKGAGSLPTASAVIGDVIDIVKNISCNNNYYHTFNSNSKITIKEFNQIQSRYYIRLHTIDKPGVFSSISRVLGDNNISISSVLQKETGQKIVPIVMLTHKAREKDIQKAISKIKKMKIVKKPLKIIRIEDD